MRAAIWALLVGVAQAETARAAPPRNAPEAPLQAAAGVDGSRARIVLIEPDSGTGLGELLLELLGRQGVSAELVRAQSFERDLLFSAATDDGAMSVFIVISASEARLYFRGPGGERFLLRRLALSHGLDPVAKEALGQVVESSALALLYSEAGVDRAQARAEVERESAPPAAVPEHPAPSATRPRAAAPSPARAARPAGAPATRPWRYELDLAARYAARWAGPDIGLAHGPGVEVGLRRRGTVSFGLLGSAERHFDHELRVASVTAGLSATALRAAFALGLELARTQALDLALGAGVDLVSVQPRATGDGTLTLAAASTRSVPFVRPEVRYELTFGHLIAGVGAFVDVSADDSHYDIVEGGTRRRVAAPWRVAPGALLALGGRFGW